MTLPINPEPPVEQDSRFPSGPWQGFFLQAAIAPGRHGMDLYLTFRQGTINGEGRDRLGRFLIVGRYDVSDGKCRWTKRYIGQHSVAYQGYNEGKGIWGSWRIPPLLHGGFHIWPAGMGEQDVDRLAEEEDAPVLVGVGAPSAGGFIPEEETEREGGGNSLRRWMSS